MLEEKIREYEREGEAYLSLRIRPNAARTMLREALADGSFKMDVAAPAEKGRANQAIIEHLSGKFRVSRTSVRILGGAADRKKLIKVSKK